MKVSHLTGRSSTRVTRPRRAISKTHALQQTACFNQSPHRRGPGPNLGSSTRSSSRFSDSRHVSLLTPDDFLRSTLRFSMTHLGFKD
jgi:hypothetical protein